MAEPGGWASYLISTVDPLAREQLANRDLHVFHNLRDDLATSSNLQYPKPYIRMQ